MADQRKSLLEFSVEELDQELIARGAQTPAKKQFKFKDREGTPEINAIMTGIQELYETTPPPNEALAHISTWDLARILIFKTRGSMDFTRGPWSDDLMDWHEIMDQKIKKNANCVAAIMLKKDLIDEKNGFSTMRVKNYGEAFNLCKAEPFRDQPVAAGRLCSGFLVKKDVIAISGHCVETKTVTDLRIVFGYKMLDPYKAVTQVPDENIYKGVKIIQKVLNRKVNWSDWALVQLDREVEGWEVVSLSNDEIVCDKPVYVMGHPMGLPLKYAAGASVRDNSHEANFTANLNIYMGNSGSPVFDLHTHEVIGMVVKGEMRDFRWTGKGWMSIKYSDGKNAGCTRVSEFIDIVWKL